MCGIVGYIGKKNVKEIILKGLERLEYRGYDSAGIALFDGKDVKVFKDQGRIAHLREVIDFDVSSTLGMGHTRWATHGKPNRINSHPHQCSGKRFTIVHNGIIENEEELKEKYLKDVDLESETDTEVVAQLLNKFTKEGEEVNLAIRHLMSEVKGSYALAIIDGNNKEKMYAAKNKSPLLIGKGDSFNMVGSDAMAMISHTNNFYELNDGEYVEITKDKVDIYNIYGVKLSRKTYKAELDSDDIYIIACGTSYHAGLVGKYYFEKITEKPAEVHVSSEFVYNTPILSKKPLFIFISQSGETADSRAVLVKVKELGYPTITLTNVKGSTLYRETDNQLLLYAGPEIAVASTKAYTAQIALLAIMAVKASDKGIDLIKELSISANVMEALCDSKDLYKDLSKKYLRHTRNCFYIGRHLDYYLCMEAALKLKEISYIQTEGFAAGELKHGTIALIEEGTPVIAVITQERINLNTRSNIKEVSARGAEVITISRKSISSKNDQIVLGDLSELLTPLAAAIPVQLLAYYAALDRGCDIDKPRNLAKSVTVE